MQQAQRVSTLSRAFTLVELLVCVAIIAVLSTLALGVFAKMKQSAYQAKSIANLRQLGIATQLYLGEHDYQFFNYRLNTGQGTTWWYGTETTASQASGEGHRSVDKTQSPLYPYLNQVGGVEIDPGFDYTSPDWKPKYSGATYGYGYNTELSYSPASPPSQSRGWIGGVPYRVQNLSSASQVLLFATCAQINTFQSGSSKSQYPVEEFPGFDEKERTIHGRFGGKGLALFVDLHVALLPLYPGTLDKRSPTAHIGRFTPKGSFQWLR
jgi:prepilin-type N-terminal cleavage/methylation domain-containing protein